MDEPRNNDTPRRYEETNAPQNPPNSVLNKGARNAVVWSYFAPVVVLFIVVGVALVYWSNQPERSQSGERAGAEVGTVGREDGGFNPTPEPNDAQAEIEFRGGDLAPITSVGQLRDVDARTMNGRRVSIDEAEVDSASGNTLWVRDGDDKFAVIAPDGSASVKAGTKVAISGQLVADSNGAAQIRADRIQAR